MEKVCICKQCGRSYIYNGHNSKDYCVKHKGQLDKYGKFLDSNPRTKYDANEFRVTPKWVEFDVYQPTTCDVTGTFKIDFDDYQRVSKHKWCMNKQGYALTRIGDKNILLHRFILNPKEGQVVDHINLDTKDNRKINLRVCSQALNTQNRRPYNKYSIKGIEQTRSGKWSAYFRNNNKQYHSQGYDTVEEATFARFILEQLFGEGELAQHNQEYINKLTKDQKEYVVATLYSKFNI